MSRIGKKLIKIPAGVTINLTERILEVKGPKGSLPLTLPAEIDLEVKDGNVHVTRTDETKRVRALHGLIRSLVNNMVTGVSNGFVRELDVIGVGYKAEVQGNKLVLSLGYSHLVEYPVPEGIKVRAEKAPRKIPNYIATIFVEGIDKRLVGQVSAEIRGYRKPDSYKGKGIRYSDETIRLKEGKKTA